MIRVLIVDDQDMIRYGLRAILELDPNIDVVGDVDDGYKAVDIVASHSVDVVLMDIRMPGIDGVETTKRIRRNSPAENVRIIVLTTFDQDETVFAALRAGADGFLGKGVGPAELRSSIDQVHKGGGVLSSAAAATLIEHVSGGRHTEVDIVLVDRFESLTPRERDVVIAVATGKSNSEIAAEMFVSPFTVKTHANRAMLKVAARDRAQLIAFAYQAGIVM